MQTRAGHLAHESISTATRPRAWLALALALMAQACMSEPLNEDVVAGTRGSVHFAGYLPTPGTSVSVMSASGRVGVFTTFATARSETRAVRVAGVALYPWSINAIVPTWSTLGCSSEVFVRARASGSNLTTFDAASITHTPGGGFACAVEVLRGPSPSVAALSRCVSPQSPTVHLVSSGSGSYAGDATVSTQADADALACYARIEGSLTLADNPAALSIALPNLQSIGGDLTIVYSRDPASPTTLPVVRSVSAPQLTSVAGDVSLSYPGMTSDLANFDLGLDALSSVGANVSVTFATFNATVQGLDALTTIPGDLTLVSDGDDFTGYGLLPVLTHIGGDVTASNGNTLTGMLDNLVSIDGTLDLSESYVPPGANFHDLQTIGGDLVLHDLQALVSVSSFDPPFPSLLSVEGTLDIERTGQLTDLVLGDSSSLEVGALYLDTVYSLDTLTASNLTVAPTGSITITNNSALCESTVQSFLAAQTSAGWAGTATTSGNGNASCP